MTVLKQWKFYIIGLVAIVALLGTTALAFAAPSIAPFGHRGGPGGPDGRGPGPGGEVTAVGDSSLTVETPNGDTLTVNVTEDTRIMIIETGSEGSLSDIEVGDNVHVMGRPDDNGVVEAKGIALEPDGDRLGGRVTAIDGNTISVENRDGSGTITVSDSTTYRTRDGEASLSDITTDSHVQAFGTLEDDGSLTARVVLTGDGPGRGPHGDGDRPCPKPEQAPPDQQEQQ